jgi:hypothetical protein
MTHPKFESKTDSSSLNVPSVSIDGAPEIVFRFAGHTCVADMAGARLYCEMRGDGGIDMRLTNAVGEVLADIIVNERAHRNATENLMDIGSALLWSHWRWLQSVPAEDAAPLTEAPAGPA